MKPETKHTLLRKGWTPEEYQKAETMIERSTEYDKLFSKIVFGSALVVIIFAHILVAVVLIPFLIALTKGVVYAVVILLAAMMGFVYNFLIMDIGHIEKKHRLFASIIIPVLAFATMIVMVLMSNSFVKELQVQSTPYNPWIIGIIFGVVFIFPYAIDRIFLTSHSN